ncbi:MAG: hypothetical protein A3G81_29660 [Betaproteobacteria bacterium RIFCSPLOWO2_12_FULL_65_14]|nr:MAG: hypothetical protein A3G81_29660 [Betaproteobacteria bacterium RIFCSPLOWO2_12_FULL_65_14]
MFNPSREEVREMFFRAWRAYRDGIPIAGIEALALDVILQHPEYHSLLEHPERFREKDYADEGNPFLHMSLHVALEEQLSIDQPPGIRSRWQALLARCGERHDALHQAIECLAEMLWRSQRDGLPPDAAAYLSCLERRARP